MALASKQTAQYQSHPNGGQHCQICTMFRSPHSCTAVAGEISPQGYCRYFEKRKDMPLIKSGSKAAVGKNIAEMEAAGHPRNQAIAAAMDTARRYRADGGAAVAGPAPLAGGPSFIKALMARLSRGKGAPKLGEELEGLVAKGGSNNPAARAIERSPPDKVGPPGIPSPVGRPDYNTMGLDPLTLRQIEEAKARALGQEQLYGMYTHNKAENIPDIFFKDPQTAAGDRARNFWLGLEKFDDMQKPPPGYKLNAAGGTVRGYGPGGLVGDETKDILGPESHAPMLHPDMPMNWDSPVASEIKPPSAKEVADFLNKLTEDRGGETRQERAMNLSKRVTDAPTLKDALAVPGSVTTEALGLPSVARGAEKIANPESDKWDRLQGAGQVALGALPTLGYFGRTAPIAEKLAGTSLRSTGLSLGATDAPRQLADTFFGSKAQAAETGQQQKRPDYVPAAPPMKPEPPYAGDMRSPLETRQIQTDLKKEGFYQGKIDGEDKGGTRGAEKAKHDAALKDWQKAMEAYEDREVKRRTLHEQGEQRYSQETKDTKDAGERAQGIKDFEAAKGLPENQPSNPLMGYAYGVPAGLAASALMSYFGFRRPMGTAMKDANKLLANPKGRGGTEERIADQAAKINTFYTKGGAKEPPFIPNPGEVPAVQPNPAAMGSGTKDLYPQPTTGKEWKAQGLMAGSWPLESVLPSYYAYKATNRMEEAEKAVQAKPDKINIANYLDARKEAASWETAANVLRSMGLSQAAGTKISTMSRPNYTPDVTEAERRRFATDRAITQKKADVKQYESDARAAKKAQRAQEAAKAAAKAAKANGPANGGVPPVVPAIAAGSLLASPPGERSEPGSPVDQSLPLSPPVDEHSSGGMVNEPLKHHSNYQPRDDEGMFAGGPVFPKTAPSPKIKVPKLKNQGVYANGGIITSALRAAARYATGGRVGVGPLKSQDGGRTDTLPLNVPSGAFVLPADFISSIGENNTDAGQKAWQQVEKQVVARHYGANAGAATKHMAAGGSSPKVPIMAAGGEYVVAPEVVAAFGGGNVDAGHKKLEKMVTDERQRHIRKLASLPAPQR